MTLWNNTIGTISVHKGTGDDLLLELQQEKKWLGWPLSGVLSQGYWMMVTPQRSLDVVSWMMPQKVLARFCMAVAGEYGSKWEARGW